MSVSTGPGLIVTTLILWSFRVLYVDSYHPLTPHLLAAYAASVALGKTPAVLAIFTIKPPPASTMAGANRLQRRIGARRLIFIVRSQSSGSPSKAFIPPQGGNMPVVNNTG